MKESAVKDAYIEGDIKRTGSGATLNRQVLRLRDAKGVLVDVGGYKRSGY